MIDHAVTLVIVGLIAVALTIIYQPQLALAKEESRIDCLPVPNQASEELCKQRGCVWSPVEQQDSAPIRTPWCYFPDDYTGYQLTDVSADGHYEFTRRLPSSLPDDVQQVGLQVEMVSDDTVRVRIYDHNKVRYKPVIPKLNRPNNGGEESERTFECTLTGDSHLTITRKSSGAVVFDTDMKKLIFANQFIQLNTKLNSPYIYGLGEHFDTFLKKADRWRSYSFFNTDNRPNPGGTRSYGVFPFYVNMDSDGKYAHGVYLHNSNAMDIVVQADQSVTFRPIGGILDFIIFGGPTPIDVISQYQHMVGLPDLPPRWSLGFHLCRFGYKSLNRTAEIWKSNKDAGIPFDVQWNDIDYMMNRNDFTYDEDKFNGLPEFVKELHDANMKYVILFDPGLSLEDNYEPYSLGMEMDIFIKNASGQPLVGEVWNYSKKTIFPDFSNPNSIEYWSKLFKKFHETVPYDGAWIDMNDISNFVDGSKDGCPKDTVAIDRPPYEPGFYPLITKTLCLSAKHNDGLEYDVHNLYSFYEAIATYKALQVARPTQRPFIISRSSSPGQGHYGGHWNGDLLSNWEYLKWTIPSIIEHSMYGFSMMGADICGFAGNTNEELCARWHVLGSFYTFSRNHNDDVSIDQDPASMGPTVVKAAKDSLLKKYSLLPYLYSLVHRAHLFGEPIIRGIPFEFFYDQEALSVEDQFLWGRGLMISPIVEQDTYKKSTYLPAGRWYEINVNVKDRPKQIDVANGVWHETSNVSLSDIPLFYRGGVIFPIYDNPKTTTEETTKQPISLVVALCEMKMAHGEVYLDEGDNVDGKYDHARFKSRDNKLSIRMDRYEISSSISFGHVRVLGLNQMVKSVVVNDKSIDFTYVGDVLKFDLNGITLTADSPIRAEWSF